MADERDAEQFFEEFERLERGERADPALPEELASDVAFARRLAPEPPPPGARETVFAAVVQEESMRQEPSIMARGPRPQARFEWKLAAGVASFAIAVGMGWWLGRSGGEGAAGIGFSFLGAPSEGRKAAAGSPGSGLAMVVGEGGTGAELGALARRGIPGAAAGGGPIEFGEPEDFKGAAAQGSSVRFPDRPDAGRPGGGPAKAGGKLRPGGGVASGGPSGSGAGLSPAPRGLGEPPKAAAPPVIAKLPKLPAAASLSNPRARAILAGMKNGVARMGVLGAAPSAGSRFGAGGGVSAPAAAAPGGSGASIGAAGASSISGGGASAQGGGAAGGASPAANGGGGASGGAVAGGGGAVETASEGDGAAGDGADPDFMRKNLADYMDAEYSAVLRPGSFIAEGLLSIYLADLTAAEAKLAHASEELEADLAPGGRLARHPQAQALAGKLQEFVVPILRDSPDPSNKVEPLRHQIKWYKKKIVEILPVLQDAQKRRRRFTLDDQAMLATVSAGIGARGRYHDQLRGLRGNKDMVAEQYLALFEQLQASCNECTASCSSGNCAAVCAPKGCAAARDVYDSGRIQVDDLEAARKALDTPVFAKLGKDERTWIPWVGHAVVKGANLLPNFVNIYLNGKEPRWKLRPACEKPFLSACLDAGARWSGDAWAWVNAALPTSEPDERGAQAVGALVWAMQARASTEKIEEIVSTEGCLPAKK